MNDYLLSIIIPCKNEEENIARCLKSVCKEAKHIKNSQILLVDSASTDKSIAIAKGFPVNIIQLKAHWLHSPAAAKYLGCLYTKGKYIFTIDADMELLPNFLEQALKFMEQDNNVAGVAGMGVEVYKEGGRLEDLYGRKSKLQEVKFLGGAALYRRVALEKVGYFNPYLQPEEEIELAQRLRKAGYKLICLPYSMTIHYTSQSMEKFFQRLRKGLFLGPGQMLRLTFGKREFFFHLWRFRMFAVFICIMTTLMVINIYIFLSKNYFLFPIEVTSMLLFWLLMCLLKRSFRKGTLSTVKWLVINLSIASGIIKKPKNPQTYPRDVLIIQRSKN